MGNLGLLGGILVTRVRDNEGISQAYKDPRGKGPYQRPKVSTLGVNLII